MLSILPNLIEEVTELTPAAGSADAPRYSIVTAVYNVARYLDEFIESIERQSLDWSRYEVVAVDDGSTDDSLDRLRQWAARRPDRVRVVTKENGGQSTARNLGIEHARGDWVTFTDPDDVLDPAYLHEVDQFLTRFPETPMVGTYRVFLDDDSGELSDTHPLRPHFAGRSALRSLEGWPSHFHGSAPAAFFRRDRIEELGLRFDPEVRPNFEDGHFCVRYLLAEEHPAVGFVKTAVYQYRKRSDASSTLQTSLPTPTATRRCSGTDISPCCASRWPAASARRNGCRTTSCTSCRGTSPRRTRMPAPVGAPRARSPTSSTR